MTAKLLISSLLTLSMAIAPAMAEDHHWGYEGEGDPAHWGDISDDFKECGAGQEQSPIDIIPAKAISAEFRPAEVHWEAFTPAIVDNGHTIQVIPMARAAIPSSMASATTWCSSISTTSRNTPWMGRIARWKCTSCTSLKPVTCWCWVH